MAKKNNAPPPEDSEQQELEDKIKKMLDPREPDPVEEKGTTTKKDKKESLAEMLPTKIEIQDDQPAKKETKKSKASDEPSGAPEVTSGSKKIAVTHDEPEVNEEADMPKTDESKEASEPDEVSEKSTEDSEEHEPETDDTADEKIENKAEEDSEPQDTEDTQTEDQDAISDESEDEAAAEETKQDDSLDAAVDDIAKEESDKLLEEDDKSIAEKVKKSEEKRSFKQKVKAFFAAWWRNKTARYSTILAILVALVAVALIPSSRYFLLNLVGVRSSASIQILDQSTQQPLKNVTVDINGVRAQTDIDGLATLRNIKLGDTRLIIEKRAFQGVERRMTVGWGSNPLPSEQLTPVGTQYIFSVKDYTNDAGVEGVEAVHEDASALSNQDGEIKLTLDKPADSFEVQLIGEGYRTETITVDASNEATIERKLVPSKKHVYISRRSGTYDVYAAYIDGSEEKLLLKGSGEERDDITLVSHPQRDVVALVSTRSGERNNDGFQLSSLTLIDSTNPEKVTEVVKSERIQLIGWQQQRLVFVQIKAGTSAANPDRHQLKAYNLEQEVAAELASANYFNDVMLVNNAIFYAPSSAYAKESPGLFSIRPDGSDKKTIHGKEVWSLFRTDYEAITFTTGKDWYSLQLADGNIEQLDGQPNEYVSRIYIDGPNSEKSVRVEGRDGKGALLLLDTNSGEEKVLFEQGGLQLPVTWLNQTTLTFRIKTDTETADYAININSGPPKKIADVTDADGIERWYYY